MAPSSPDVPLGVSPTDGDGFRSEVLDVFPGEVVDPESPPAWEDAVPIEVEYFDPATWASGKTGPPAPRRWKNEGVVERQGPSLFGKEGP